MKDNCSDRIKQALNLRSMKPIDLVEKSGVKKSALSQYMSGKITPRQKALDSMAKVLNVSPAWLMGFDVPMEREDILKKNEFEHKNHNENPKIDFKGDFTITENIEGEHIRILNVSNDKTADERIYDLKTNKYNEKKINKIIISFNIDNENYTAEDTNKFIKLFSEYKKLSNDKQKEIDDIIFEKKFKDIGEKAYLKNVENFQMIFSSEKNEIDEIKKKLKTFLINDYHIKSHLINFYKFDENFSFKNLKSLNEKIKISYDKMKTFIFYAPKDEASKAEKVLKEQFSNIVTYEIDNTNLITDTMNE